jgi:mRNA-degrading endonuclease toxin of MazEF toxin-antitoxin module
LTTSRTILKPILEQAGLLDQIRTLDKVRLVRHAGAAHSATLKRALAVLQTMFALAS